MPEESPPNGDMRVNVIAAYLINREGLKLRSSV